MHKYIRLTNHHTEFPLIILIVDSSIIFSYAYIWTFHIMVTSASDMCTTIVICTVIQTMLTAAIPSAYSQTPINTIFEGFSL